MYFTGIPWIPNNFSTPHFTGKKRRPSHDPRNYFPIYRKVLSSCGSNLSLFFSHVSNSPYTDKIIISFLKN